MVGMHSLGLVWLWLYMSYGVYGKLYSVSAVILLCISEIHDVGGHWQVKNTECYYGIAYCSRYAAPLT